MSVNGAATYCHIPLPSTSPASVEGLLLGSLHLAKHSRGFSSHQPQFNVWFTERTVHDEEQGKHH